MHKRLKQALQYGLSLGLMGLFIYWAFEGINRRELWDAMTGISPVWAAVLCAATLGTLGLRAWRWLVLMRPFAPQVSTLNASLALAICYAANVAVPRSGEVLRCVSLKWTTGASISALMATIVVERILDLFWLIALFWLIVYIDIARLVLWIPAADRDAIGLLALAACLVALSALVLVSVYREKILAGMRPLLGRLAWGHGERVLQILETFIGGLSALRQQPTAYLEILVSSILLNAAYVFIIYAAFIGMDLHQPYDLDAAAALAVMAISSIGVIIPTPGAIGSYHFLFGEALHHLYAVPLPTALACATLTHALATLTYILIGAPTLLWQWHRAGRAPTAPRTPTKPTAPS